LVLWGMEPTFNALTMPQRMDKFLGRETQVHKIAKAAAVTLAVLILPAASFAEIRDWRKLGIQRSASIPAIVQIVDRCLSLGLPFVACIHIPNQMIADVVTYVQLEKISKLSKLNVEIFVNGVEAVLKLFLGELANGVVGRVMIDIW